MDLASLPDHIRRPHVRPIQPVRVTRDGRVFVALRDPTMLSKQTMVVPPPALAVIQQFKGEDDVDLIADRISSPIDQVIKLAEGLDKLGLLWGPSFDALENRLRARLASSGVFPTRASGTLGNDEQSCRDAVRGYFEQTEDPELDGQTRAIVAPHLDYERGWPNYAAAYWAMQHMEPPDRVVILGTNHFGLGDGVIMTEFGFQSPLGRCAADRHLVEALHSRLGDGLFVDQLDHMAEHSIELQLPWIQYCFGPVPIAAALIPDPLAELIDDDPDKRISPEQFTIAMRESLDELGGRTFYIASSDLSHVGPQFGEPRAVDDLRRMDVERLDRDMLGNFIDGDVETFLSGFEWNRNPTRWCSIGNMSVLLDLVAPEQVALIDYRQAVDDKGVAMVTSAALALL